MIQELRIYTARAGGAPALYFPNDRVPPASAWQALPEWSRELARVARHDDHPWQEALMIDALVTQGRLALAAAPPAPAPQRPFATLPP